MLLYKDKSFITNSAHPNDDWVGNADWVIPDDSELAKDILRISPYFNLITSAEGELIDIEPYDPPDPEPVEYVPTNKELAQQITDIQLALVEMYETGGV